MDKMQININYKDAEALARKCFIHSSELGAEAENHKVLMDESLQALKNCKETINLKATIRPLDKEEISPCVSFAHIEKQHILNIYEFLITLGKCQSPNTNYAEQYYVDIWAECFFEASRNIIREKIRKQLEIDDQGRYISYAYGPGLYGVDPSKINDIIDITLPKQRLSGGFFFVTDKKYSMPPFSCKDCHGHEKGCLVCGGLDVIPTRSESLKLLNAYGTPEHVIRHNIAVSETALVIARALIEKGYKLDLELLEAATLLHDIARVEENHGVKGAEYLAKKGHRKVAKLVKGHMFYGTDPYKTNITELDILCLADRMVKEDQYVGIETRMKFVLDKLTSKGVDTEKVMIRTKENIVFKEKIENIIGKTIDSLMEEQGNNND